MSAKSKNARMIKRGDIVSIKLDNADEPTEEVVRDVSMILHLANGRDVHVKTTEEVTLVEDEEVLASEPDAEG